MRKSILIIAVSLICILANPVFVKAQILTEDEIGQMLNGFSQFDKNSKKINKNKKSRVRKTYLKLTNTGRKFSSGKWKGLCQLELEYIKNGRSEDSIIVVSGIRSQQFFRTGEDSERGSFEPLPEGKWYINDINWWKRKKDVYQGVSWGEGLGPVIIRLEYISPGDTSRAGILIHLDSNYSNSPGTAGCIGVRSVEDFKRLVEWLRETDPRNLYVDWGLGSVDY